MLQRAHRREAGEEQPLCRRKPQPELPSRTSATEPQPPSDRSDGGVAAARCNVRHTDATQAEHRQGPQHAHLSGSMLAFLWPSLVYLISSPVYRIDAHRVPLAQLALVVAAAGEEPGLSQAGRGPRGQGFEEAGGRGGREEVELRGVVAVG